MEKCKKCTVKFGEANYWNVSSNPWANLMGGAGLPSTLARTQEASVLHSVPREAERTLPSSGTEHWEKARRKDEMESQESQRRDYGRTIPQPAKKKSDCDLKQSASPDTVMASDRRRRKLSPAEQVPKHGDERGNSATSVIGFPVYAGPNF